MVTFYASHHVVPLPPGHRFPMEKYAKTLDLLSQDPTLNPARLDLRPGPLADLGDLALVHDPEYIRRFVEDRMTVEEMRNVGFPWSPELAGRTLASAGGTIEACRLLLEGRFDASGGKNDTRRPRGEDVPGSGGGAGWRGEGGAPPPPLLPASQRPRLMMAGNMAGGTHHAFRDRGEGFCVFNDLAVAAAVAMRDYGVERILILDLDVHQGNGTAALFEDDPRVTTFDIHGAGNYPWRSRMTNTYDVALPDGTGDEEYLALLRAWLPRLMAQHQPQLILFQAGVDALGGDSFGRLALSRQGLLERNHLVYSLALENGVPLCITMGGGYTRPPDASIACHADVYRSAAYRLHAWAMGEMAKAGADRN